jgi:hypothetical protein
VDDQTKRVLRRVCAQFHTGIRKPFGIHGKMYKLVVENGIGLVFESTQDRYNVEWLSEVTAESILTAIDTFEVRRVMDS